MDSDNRKNNRGDDSAVRSSQRDMSKYAGAMSNKSRRNYSELKLVRPQNITEYASNEAAPRKKRHPEAGELKIHTEQRGKAKKGTGSKPKSTASKPQSTASSSQRGKAHAKSKSGGKSSAKLHSGSRVKSVSERALDRLKAGGAPKKSPQGKKNLRTSKKKFTESMNRAEDARRLTAEKYSSDEYSKALNSSDFYSSVVEKYYIKHPEEAENRVKSGKSRVKNTAQSAPKKSGKSSFSDKSGMASSGNRKHGTNSHASSVKEKSVAELAVKGRGTAHKKKHAQVVKSGRVKGVVEQRPTHRKVRQRNRRRTVIFNSLMVMTTVIFLLAVYVTVFFNVRNIVINGETPYQAARIMDMCGFSKGDNILFVDSASSEKNIIANLPYIESCKIKRRLPSTVEIDVIEAVPLGVAEISTNQWAVISSKGKILEIMTNQTVVSSSDVITNLTYDAETDSVHTAAARRALPAIIGFDLKNSTADGYIVGEAAESLSDFVAIAEEAKRLNMNITTMSLSDKGYEVSYEGRINIVLGDVTDKKALKTRMETADYIVSKSGDLTEHEYGEITYIKNKIFYSPTYEKSG